MFVFEILWEDSWLMFLIKEIINFEAEWELPIFDLIGK